MVGNRRGDADPRIVNLWKEMECDRFVRRRRQKQKESTENNPPRPQGGALDTTVKQHIEWKRKSGKRATPPGAEVTLWEVSPTFLAGQLRTADCGPSS